MLVRIHSVLTPEQRRGLDAIAKRHRGRAESHEIAPRTIFTFMELGMVRRKLVAAAAFVAVRCRARPPRRHQRRTRRGRKISSSRRSSGTPPASKRRACAARRTRPAAPTVPLTLEDAVRRAIDNNLEMAVERLNPQTFDFTLASLRANYNPIATSRFGRRDNVRPPTNLLNPGSPNVSTMTYNAGIAQNLRWGGGNYALTFNNAQDRLADRPARDFRSAVQQLVSLQLHAAAAARVPDRSDAAADADDHDQPRQRRAEPEGADHQHAGRGASAYWDYVVFDPGGRRGQAVARRSRRSCCRTTRFASKSARWRRWTSCRPKRRRRRGSRR